MSGSERVGSDELLGQSGLAHNSASTVALSPAYRCGECGRSDQLSAIAEGYMEGPLGADGQLVDYSLGIEDYGLISEASIQCSCGGFVIEKNIDGVWHRWQPCPNCIAGRSKTHRSYEFHKCPTCDGAGGKEVPVHA